MSKHEPGSDEREEVTAVWRNSHSQSVSIICQLNLATERVRLISRGDPDPEHSRLAKTSKVVVPFAKWLELCLKILGMEATKALYPRCFVKLDPGGPGKRCSINEDWRQESMNSDAHRDWINRGSLIVNFLQNPTRMTDTIKTDDGELVQVTKLEGDYIGLNVDELSFENMLRVATTLIHDEGLVQRGYGLDAVPWSAWPRRRNGPMNCTIGERVVNLPRTTPEPPRRAVAPSSAPKVTRLEMAISFLKSFCNVDGVELPAGADVHSLFKVVRDMAPGALNQLRDLGVNVDGILSFQDLNGLKVMMDQREEALASREGELESGLAELARARADLEERRERAENAVRALFATELAALEANASRLQPVAVQGGLSEEDAKLHREAIESSLIDQFDAEEKKLKAQFASREAALNEEIAKQKRAQDAREKSLDDREATLKKREAMLAEKVFK